MSSAKKIESIDPLAIVTNQAGEATRPYLLDGIEGLLENTQPFKRHSIIALAFIEANREIKRLRTLVNNNSIAELAPPVGDDLIDLVKKADNCGLSPRKLRKEFEAAGFKVKVVKSHGVQRLLVSPHDWATYTRHGLHNAS